MDKQSCFELGYISKSFGLKGQVNAIFDVDEPQSYRELESVFLELKGTLIPFFIKEILIDRNNRITLHFEDTSTQDDANQLKGTKLFLPVDLLPPSEDDELYLHEYVGLEVYEKDRYLGKITSYTEAGVQLILTFEHQGKEVLFPLKDEVVKKVSKKDNRIEVVLPHGLLEVYLSE
jgi:16S rRNA processing protein RimM